MIINLHASNVTVGPPGVSGALSLRRKVVCQQHTVYFTQAAKRRRGRWRIVQSPEPLCTEILVFLSSTFRFCYCSVPVQTYHDWQTPINGIYKTYITLTRNTKYTGTHGRVRINNFHLPTIPEVSHARKLNTTPCSMSRPAAGGAFKTNSTFNVGFIGGVSLEEPEMLSWGHFTTSGEGSVLSRERWNHRGVAVNAASWLNAALC